jgi:rhamnosyltransferase subunit B
MHARKGPERLIRRILYGCTPAAYAEVMDALRGADAIVTHPITLAAQIAAEKSGLPWISTVTAPIAFFSKYRGGRSHLACGRRVNRADLY